MGNIFSANFTFELYQWSSEEYPKEYAVIYTSVTDKSKFCIFRLSVKPEKLQLRVADILCHSHPVRFHMEVTAERDNGLFNLRVVRVVEAGTSQSQTSIKDKLIFDYFCESRACVFGVDRRGSMSSSDTNRNWEVVHSYAVGYKTDIKLYVVIKCDKMTGLSAEFRGPFKCEGLITFLIPKTGSLIQREVKGEPPKHISAIVDSVFTGKQFVLFNQGKGNNLAEASLEGQHINNSGNFIGNGNYGFLEN
ncbi:hypothetical protein CR513_45065, partial [Mucuna pruriens]